MFDDQETDSVSKELWGHQTGDHNLQQSNSFSKKVGAQIKGTALMTDLLSMFIFGFKTIVKGLFEMVSTQKQKQDKTEQQTK